MRTCCALLITALLIPSIGLPQANPAVEFGTSLVKELGLSTLIEKVFDKFLQDKTPQQAARPKIRELYAALLDVKEKREALRVALRQRSAFIAQPNNDADAKAVSRDETANSVNEAKKALIRLKKAFDELHVDLDASDPELSTSFGNFMAAQQPIYLTKSINLDDQQTLRVADVQLERNTENLDKALKQLRELTHKAYPEFGELLSPGLFH